jgi:hypothetical protein
VLALPLFALLAWRVVDAFERAGAVLLVDPDLPQSVRAAAETICPWSGPGGVDWATPETYSPWFVTSAGQAGTLTALAGEANFDAEEEGAAPPDRSASAVVELAGRDVAERSSVEDVVASLDDVDDSVVVVDDPVAVVAVLVGGSSPGTTLTLSEDLNTLAAAAVIPPTPSATTAASAASFAARARMGTGACPF